MAISEDTKGDLHKPVFMQLRDRLTSKRKIQLLIASGAVLNLPRRLFEGLRALLFSVTLSYLKTGHVLFSIDLYKSYLRVKSTVSLVTLLPHS